jgi:hypothetical protein
MIIKQYLICEKCGRKTLHRFGGLCPRCERKDWERKTDYSIFFQLICERVNDKISKERFVFDWAREQKRQGITPQRGRFARP